MRDRSRGFTGGSDGRESACNAGDLSSIPGLGGPPGEGNGNPLQYPCLGNRMVRGAWSAAVHGVAKCWTWLSDSTTISGSHSGHHCCFLCLFTNSTFIFLQWTPKEENQGIWRNLPSRQSVSPLDEILLYSRHPKHSSKESIPPLIILKYSVKRKKNLIEEEMQSPLDLYENIGNYQDNFQITPKLV